MNSTGQEPGLSTVAFRGRQTQSHPHLPLATLEDDSEAVCRKGKSSRKEVSITETGNTPSPSVKTPFSYSHLPSRPSSEVSHFLNFGSVPVEFSPPSLVSEGEILVTPPSLEFMPQLQTLGLRRFLYPSFYCYYCIERSICTFRSLSLLSIFPVVSFENLLSDISPSHFFSSYFSST
jgi:hypothetical protein